MQTKNFNIKGLTNEEVLQARSKYGYNKLEAKKEYYFFEAIRSLVKEPMVILLLVASAIYFISGNIGDGIFLSSATVLVAAISLYQDSRSRNALEKLKTFSEPKCKVIRNGKTEDIKSENLVVGDSLIVEEGGTVAADGIIVHSNDFSVNESILTGESLSVYKDKTKADHKVYQGTLVSGGLAIVTVTAIGNETQLGKIGKSIEGIQKEKTPLELQINNFVKKMAIVGAIIFIIVWAINYYHSHNILDSLLKALTLAMSILPEEIPVAFTTFMALGAWRLMKLGVIVKQIKTVETLGSATIICTDKTGTITENKMSLARLFTLSCNKIFNINDTLSNAEKELIKIAMWASEPIPFDPMEIALHNAYKNSVQRDERSQYAMVHEYPLGGKPPMMTHIFKNIEGKRIIAAKGAPEALMAISNLSTIEKEHINKAIETITAEGYRVLGVADANFEGDNYPKTQQDFQFNFKGIVAFYDPPKKNIASVLEDFRLAGIKVKIITGDNALTTRAIAKEIGFKGFEKSMSGDELMQLNDTELRQKVEDTTIFTRMFPQAKLKIINALKANKEIVAMTGDGVNDGPALKAAHIGIAMGKKGTETAKQAATLILLEDDLSKMVDAIAMGRRIYANLKKAIQYIISIHIPIILTVFIPLALGWEFPNIFYPVHIIFLELIMGPTCSIIYENEPIEKNSMLQKPRPFTVTFFNGKELATSIVQGLIITLGVLMVYQYGMQHDYSESLTRSMVFTTLIAANIFLTLVNRSFYYSVLTTLKYENKLVPLIIGVTITITASLLFIPPFTKFFKFETLSFSQLFISILTGFIAVIWYEIVKWNKRKKNRN
ncbi:cation-translocating P-type ATPase [Winogradskyella helgolandensis]|uniref:cation-translocating P-type ATPase n=1 Tax=Winogradskyella helgolandensis TaxID=2697010 RepID=UPI0015B9127C|nr:cation-translocating P-type ATPase [Winogradskyella helgolandensis]